MGLDMYMTARKSYRTQYVGKGKDFRALPPLDMDGFALTSSTAEVLYWRKNHWLHGYMVTHFCGGDDSHQRVPLTSIDLHDLAEVLEQWQEDPDRLSATDGFFYGSKDDEWRDMCRDRIPDDLVEIRKLIKWLEDYPTEAEWREVFYQASW